MNKKDMNKSEEKGYAWLLRKGYKSGEVVYQKRGIDFICADGKGYEVKRLYGHTILFHKGQLERTKNINNTVLVFDDEHLGPIAVILSMELEKDKIISGIKITIIERKNMLKKWLDIDDDMLKRFERVAVAKFGLYGAITKGANEAIELWVDNEEGGGNQL